jgi:hypothetical protein
MLIRLVYLLMIWVFDWLASWSTSRRHGQPDRLGEFGLRKLIGEQGTPTPFSRQRRRAAA